MALYINGNKMSGGTTVIANPEGSPTDELQTIQIGNDIYEIVGGGGSSGEDILIKDRDWTLITSSFGTTQLTNTYDYYLWIVICNGKIDYYKIIDSSLLDLETNEDSIIEYKSWDDGQGAFSSSRVTITASSVTLWDNNQSAVSVKLYGANKKSGGGSTSWKDVTGTLTAGQTSLTLMDSAITEDSTFDFYTSKFGVNPTDVSVSTGSITLTFDSQSTDIDVKVRVTNDESPYTFKNYLEVGSTAGPYIDTNFALTTNSEWEIKTKFTDTPNNDGYVFGAWISNGGTYLDYYSGTIRISCNNEKQITLDTNDHTYKITQSDMTQDGVSVGTPNWNGIFSSSTAGIFTDGARKMSNRVINTRIYYCKIWNNGTLVRDFVPAIRKADNEIGMYDKVNNVFYTNDGTGTFTTD